MSKSDIEETKKHLCDSCERADEFPRCMPSDVDEVEYGFANGLDNIVHCTNYTTG